MVGPVDAGDAKPYVDGFLAGASRRLTLTCRLNAFPSPAFGDTALAAEAAQHAYRRRRADRFFAAGGRRATAAGEWRPVDRMYRPTQSTPFDGHGQRHLRLEANCSSTTLAKREAGTMGGEVLQLTYANGGIRIAL
ncbi:MAG: hypothetical protein H6639_10155 [Caldilineaceae bacterium]|nr:hypothetical protein [Caldilineaceae bacterium]